MRIAVTADLHYGHNVRGDEATNLMLELLRAQPADVLLLGGDIGTGHHFDECLRLFADLPGAKAVVPGNHDVWVNPDDERGDSLTVYEKHLPAICQLHGYRYLDQAPLLLPDAGLAIVGSMNWYDYSWSIDRMKAEVPDWEWHLYNKAFTRGRHNDGRFVLWPTNDVDFTRRIVAEFERQLVAALGQVERAIVLTHHPAFQGISFPRTARAEGVDSLLWEALSGNRAIEQVLERHADRIPMIFSGHTHRDVEAKLGASQGHNVGGDYHFKRLLIVDWPSGKVDTHIFGDPTRRR